MNRGTTSVLSLNLGTRPSSPLQINFSAALASAQTQQMRSGAQNEEADEYAGRDDQKQNG